MAGLVRKLFLSAVAVCAFYADIAYGKNFAPHEDVYVVTNKIGPFNNPSETYQYYQLPFCRSHGKLTKHKKKHQRHDLGEILVGDRKQVSPYEITFQDPVPWRMLCQKDLDEDDIRQFQSAIEDDYYFEFFIDELPMWGYIGEIEGDDLLLGHLEGSRTYLYPHLHFTIGYNNDQIVSANVSTNPQKRVDITDAHDTVEVTFSYSVEWVHEPNLPHELRLSRYHGSAFFPSSFEIHWLSVINSFVLVLLLTAFLSIILLRVLKNDFSRYMELDEDDEMGDEETGWKLIHGDVFRFPANPTLFASMVGTGAHLLCTLCLLLLSTLLGIFRPTKRGALLTATIVWYTCSAFVGGFVSGRLHKQLMGHNWAWALVCTAVAFPLPLILVFLFVNTIAWANGSTTAIPFLTFCVVTSLYFFVVIPLTILGGIVGRNVTAVVPMSTPCRTTKVPREVPADIPWYRRAPAQMFMAGFLPFSAIYIELHYIFASVWGHKIYTLFGILSLAFVMLFVVTSFITVALVYFQLAREDHRWWWRSFASGGATGLFILAYSFFYYHHRSSMDGFLQASFYFGYMSVVSYAFFLMLGTIGFYSSLVFVKSIYSVVKCD